MKIHTAHRWGQRLKGLLGTKELGSDEALHLQPCNSVHTLGMRYAIDVVFLDKNGRILKIVHGLKPHRVAWCWQAHSVLELAAGQAQARGWQVAEDAR
jgi:uncharacterized membrane protein (UPF0127 family)